MKCDQSAKDKTRPLSKRRLLFDDEARILLLLVFMIF
jgi:hypothetical protein